MPWEWKSMAVKIRIGEAINFWKLYFHLLGNLSPENECPFHSSPRFFIFLTQLELAGSFPHVFPAFSSFFPYPEIRLCIAE